MKPLALVVDDDASIRQIVEDRLESMGHDCDLVGSQKDAADLLAKHTYSYILLDLELPVKFGKPPAIQVGLNILEQIRADERNHATPIIVITAHGKDNPELCRSILKGGAADFLTKPFANLERDIRDALQKREPKRPAKATSKNELRPFAGGELVIGTEGVELCGAMLCGAKSLIYRIIELLCAGQPGGRRTALSASVLADKLDQSRGQTAVIEAVSFFRKKVVQELREHSFEATDDSVIITGRRGYELAPAIQVAARAMASAPVSEEPTPEQRQAWFVEQLRQERKLRRSDYERHFGISTATAKRDLRALEAAVVFVGTGDKGFYALKRCT